MPNFVTIDQTVAEIWQFSDSQDGGSLPSCVFLNSKILTTHGFRGSARYRVNFCDKWSNHCRDVTMAVCHLGFVLSELDPSATSTSWSLLLCIIWLEWAMQF